MNQRNFMYSNNHKEGSTPIVNCSSPINRLLCMFLGFTGRGGGGSKEGGLKLCIISRMCFNIQHIDFYSI